MGGRGVPDYPRMWTTEGKLCGMCNIQHDGQFLHKYNTNRYCCGKAVNITYSECVFVALVIHHAMHICCIMASPGSTTFFHIQHAMHMCYIMASPGSTAFFTIISRMTQLSEKGFCT